MEDESVFIIGGGLFLLSHHRPVEIGLGHPGATWMQTMLLLVFAYGGFEGALMPMGEAKDPRRDAPFALLAGLLIEPESASNPPSNGWTLK